MLEMALKTPQNSSKFFCAMENKSAELMFLLDVISSAFGFETQNTRGRHRNLCKADGMMFMRALRQKSKYFPWNPELEALAMEPRTNRRMQRQCQASGL
jgi:hypothetical protein